MTRNEMAETLHRHGLLACEFISEAVATTVARRLVELEAERDEARNLAAQRGEQMVRLRAERDAARAEVERMRAVVGAAMDMRAVERCFAGKGVPTISEWWAAQKRATAAGERVDTALAALDGKEGEG